MFLNNLRFSKRIKFYTTNLSLNYNIEGFVYLSREEQPVILVSSALINEQKRLLFLDTQ